MKSILLAAACIFLANVLSGQVIYISSSGNAIYRLNLDDCSYTFVNQVDRQIYDIAFHPDGSLYGISGNGNFFSIDILTGMSTLLHDFGGQTFNSLTIDANGLVYTIGNDGELWSYNLTSGVAVFLGDIGYAATGDLTFYKGEFYVAATGDRIVRINLNSVANSTVIINDDIPGNILGIVSDVVDCKEINCYAITNGNSDIYQINFITNSLELVCELNITVGGGASTSEFLASSPLVIDSTDVLDPDCANQNGEAVIWASGGAGVYSYSINNETSQSSNQFTGLPEGNYTAIVQDQLGCEDTTTFMLMKSSGPSIDTILSQPAGCGETNGVLTIMASGGGGEYTFSLNGGLFQTLNVFAPLPGGPYSVVVLDQAGCTDSVNWMLEMSDAPVISDLMTQQGTCGLDNGSILAVASGGSGSLMYSIDSLQFQPTPLFSNLEPGLYTVYVIDTAGCQAQEEAILDPSSAASIIQADITNTSCNEANGIINITTDQADSIRYSIDGFNFQSVNRFENLSAGPYLLLIEDANGCEDTLSVTIDPSGIPEITSIAVLPENCGQANGSLTITSEGGTGTYQYSLDGNSYQLANTFTNLPAGAYNVFIIDDEGCSNTGQARVDAIDGLNIIEIITLPSRCGGSTGSITMDIEGGVPPVLISLQNYAPQTEELFSGLAAGNYPVHILDAAGCTTDTIVSLSQTGCPVYIPNIFSPNGDGVNDLFQIQTADANEVTITRFFIFDRWGNNVYERYDLPIHSTDGWWDGTYKRFTANPGVFAYFVEVEFDNGSRETFRGNVTLIR
jgi:gliding motility-associated-like protein